MTTSTSPTTTAETQATTNADGVQMHRVDVEVSPQHEAAITWLTDEFPDWEIAVSDSRSGDMQIRPLFIASQEGHHPQSELTPAKLHSRLSDYLGRESRRVSLTN